MPCVLSHSTGIVCFLPDISIIAGLPRSSPTILATSKVLANPDSCALTNWSVPLMSALPTEPIAQTPDALTTDEPRGFRHRLRLQASAGGHGISRLVRRTCSWYAGLLPHFLLALASSVGMPVTFSRIHVIATGPSIPIQAMPV